MTRTLENCVLRDFDNDAPFLDSASPMYLVTVVCVGVLVLSCQDALHEDTDAVDCKHTKSDMVHVGSSLKHL